LKDVDAGCQNKQQSAKDKTPGPGFEPPDGREEKNAVRDKQDRAPHIACGGGTLKDLVTGVVMARPPTATDLSPIISGDDKVD